VFPPIVRVFGEQWILIWRCGTLVELSSFKGHILLTVRITTLPELLVVRFSRLGVTVADRPNRGLNHAGADEELRNSD
jgi:hypothetical protein